MIQAAYKTYKAFSGLLRDEQSEDGGFFGDVSKLKLFENSKDSYQT